MAMTITASGVNTKGSPFRAGSDTINKVVFYTFVGNGSTSGTITSLTLNALGITTVVDAQATLSSGTVCYVTTTNNDVTINIAAAADTGRVMIMGY